MEKTTIYDLQQKRAESAFANQVLETLDLSPVNHDPDYSPSMDTIVSSAGESQQQSVRLTRKRSSAPPEPLPPIKPRRWKKIQARFPAVDDPNPNMRSVNEEAIRISEELFEVSRRAMQLSEELVRGVHLMARVAPKQSAKEAHRKFMDKLNSVWEHMVEDSI